MKVLITGATGLLGSHLIKELQQRKEKIRALVLPVENADKLLAQGVEVVRGDITDASTLGASVKGVDLIFHLAGMMGVWRPLADYRLVNVTGSENLYKAAQAAGVRRFVHTSSHTVYGLGHGRFMKEEDPLRPDPDPYSMTKAEGDRLIRHLTLNSDVETVILRPGTFFGPGDHLHFGRMAQKVKDGKGLLLGKGDNALPFCYVTDIVQGYMLAAYHEKAPGNVYNITNDQPLTQQEMFDTIADAVGGERPTLHLPYMPIYYGATVAENVFKVAGLKSKPPATQLGAMMFGSDNKHSVEKARRELGYEPKVPLREGIKLAAEWFNTGGFSEPPVTAASQNVPLAGARK
jgi:nucleoside-diphosphate-sugar epimerase